MADNAKIIWDYLKAKGLNSFGIAGVMGNLYAESGLIPTNMQNSYEKKLGFNDVTYTAAVDNGSYDNFVQDKAGYGIAQWTYWSRKQGLLDAAKKAGKSIGDLGLQLDYLAKELNSYGLMNSLKNAKSVREASDIVLLQFEKPRVQDEAVQQKRAGYSQTYYDKYAGSAAPSVVPAPSTKSSADKLIEVAIAEIGYHEKASKSNLDDKTANSGSANWTKYARDFDEKYPQWYNGKKNGYAWCDMFVDWCFLTAFGYEKALQLTCQPERSAGAGCTYSLKYYRDCGRFHTSDPQRGDQIFFGTSLSNSGHTGIVEKVENGRVHTIEGNTSDMVARRSYALTDKSILGYGRPAYDVVATPTPSSPTTTTNQGGNKMSNSPLVSYTKISPNKSSPRNHAIDTITIHCVVGQCTVETLGNIFAPSSRQASSNYGVGSDGRIGMYVEEKDRSWCSSNSANDNRAITIEVASDTTHPYAVTDAAYEGLIKLLVDICQRNNIPELRWKADKSLIGQPDKQNMTVHRWFANKSCPGDYLYECHGAIAAEVNRRLKGAQPTPAPKPEPAPTTPVTKSYLVKVTADALNYRTGPATSYPIVGVIRDHGVYTIIAEQNGWGKLKSSTAAQERWISLKYTKRV